MVMIMMIRVETRKLIKMKIMKIVLMKIMMRNYDNEISIDNSGKISKV